MNNTEMQIGRIQAVLYASEEVVTRAKRTGDTELYDIATDWKE